jgi:transmembrane sensor
MTQDKRTRFNAQIAEEAAEWFVDFRLGNIDVTGRREFDTWIRSSPENLRAYLETAAIWNEGSSLSAHRDLDSDALIALAHTEGNVILLEPDRPRTLDETDPNSPTSKESTQPTGHSSHGSCEGAVRNPRGGRVRLFAVAASILLVTVALAVFLLAPGGVYATAVGERRTLTLEDGSTVELNSRSRIRVRFAKSQRDVELLEGQVLFHVAKDSSRPFVVHSDTLSVRAVGTKFDVNRKTTGTTVTVVEGRVAVYEEGISAPGTAITPSEINTKEAARPPAPASRRGATTINPGSPEPGAGSAVDPKIPGSATIFLSPCDQLTVSDQAPPSQPQHANPATATAWTQGQLVLDAASLAEVAEEFNRYSSRRLIVADHGTRPLRLSGVFSTDPDFLLRYLRQRTDITIEATPTEVRIIHHD